MWLALGALPCSALDAADLALLNRVDAHYNHLTSLRTHYREQYRGMGMDRSEEGTLVLKKPGRMRWEYADPAGKLFVLDGKYAWFYTPGDSEAQRIPAKDMDDLRSPLRFLLGHTELKKELDGIVVKPQGAGYRIAGVPRGMAERVKALTLDVSATGAIAAMTLEEVDGAVTAFTFTGMEENVPVADSAFHFSPPAGVTVVDGMKPI
ncbi:MAG: outer membrane lipoprotein chaperone LolA [Acidobacteriota bacterium]|nr:outer membrane lipoprotein chaperone LolA [Acidobacteriota bacterium]